MALRSAVFWIDSLPGRYRGYTTGETWNGWAMPLFEKAVAEQIARDYAAQSDDELSFQARYDAEHDGFAVFDPYAEVTELYQGQQTEWGAKPLPLYPLGSGLWTWEEIPSG